MNLCPYAKLEAGRPEVCPIPFLEILKSGVSPTFFIVFLSMTHPLIPQVLDLANPVALRLGLEIVGAVFQTNQSPPVLRVDIRNPESDTGLADCERMSQALEAVLDATDVIPTAYVLEVSSPGISTLLTRDRDFVAFQGFMVEVRLSEPHRGKQTWIGQLVRRDEVSLTLSQKGKAISLPRDLIQEVHLSNQPPD